MTGKHSDDTAKTIIAFAVIYAVVIVVLTLCGGRP